MSTSGEIRALIDNGQYAAALGRLAPLLEGSQAQHGGLLHYYAAWCCDALGLERQALAHYRNAIGHGLPDVELRDAYVGLGSTHRVLGEYESAGQVLEQGLALFPQYRPLQVFGAMAAYNQGRYREAVSRLLAVLADTTADADIRRYGKAIAQYAQDIDRIDTE